MAATSRCSWQTTYIRQQSVEYSSARLRNTTTERPTDRSLDRSPLIEFLCIYTHVVCVLSGRSAWPMRVLRHCYRSLMVAAAASLSDLWNIHITLTTLHRPLWNLGRPRTRPVIKVQHRIQRITKERYTCNNTVKSHRYDDVLKRWPLQHYVHKNTLNVTND